MRLTRRIFLLTLRVNESNVSEDSGVGCRRDVLVSNHGYDELAEDDIFINEIASGISTAVIEDDYPDYHKSPYVSGLQDDGQGQSIHVVWGIPKKASSPAVVVTAYRPDPDRWSEDFLRRKQ